MDWLEGKPYTTLWIDGNHENFDLLKEEKVTEWHGGSVQHIRPSVIHLMRGQVYELEGRKAFTFGGARSHDISNGILDKTDPDFAKKKKELNKEWKPYRVNHVSWWKEEMPSENEFEEGRRNLQKNDWKIDFIFSHCCASSTQALFAAGMYKPDKLTDYLEEVRRKCEFRKWFFGHYHNNQNVSAREIMVYEQMIRI